ncbi:hypothetical protein U4960_00335 [Altererythrobacter sp. H2]|nr:MULTISPECIES: hypothetical protein [Erythrobacteraceae]EZP66670.1 hypothetical protein BV96_04497 [Sphingomonas paucimobilis]WRK95819.1 hypothetical protein U4960_00335 [Altererythrobacter sp. H2]
MRARVTRDAKQATFLLVSQKVECAVGPGADIANARTKFGEQCLFLASGNAVAQLPAGVYWHWRRWCLRRDLGVRALGYIEIFSRAGGADWPAILDLPT